MHAHAGEKIAEILMANGADVNHEDTQNKITPCQATGNPTEYIHHKLEIF